MKVKPVEHPVCETYIQKNKRLNRPMSPYITIYAMKFQTALSLGHRISGIALNGYTVLLALGSFLVYPDGYKVLVDFVESYNLPRPVILLAKLALALPCCYHYSAGLRHAMWDFTGRYLKRQDLIKSGSAVLGTTGVLTLLLMSLGFRGKPIVPHGCPPCVTVEEAKRVAKEISEEEERIITSSKPSSTAGDQNDSNERKET